MEVGELEFQTMRLPDFYGIKLEQYTFLLQNMVF